MQQKLFAWSTGTLQALVPIFAQFGSHESLRSINYKFEKRQFDLDDENLGTTSRILSAASDTIFSPPEMIVQWIFSTIFLGSVFREVNKHTGIPYTPMILVIGAIFGSIADYDNSVSQTVNYVVGLDPHAM